MDTSAEKQFISSAELLESAFQLGLQVLDSGFEPSFIVAIWRGGTPVGIAVQELLDYFGIETDHIAIRTSLYSRKNERTSVIRVHGMQYLVDTVSADDGLLIVDDVFDSGLSIEAVISELRRKARRNTPERIKVATTYFKPGNVQVDRAPDYFVHRTDKWLVFPHELHGLTPDEIRAKPDMAAIAERLADRSPEAAS